MIKKKVLVINPNKCTGCRTCEIACSFKNYQTFSPAKSRIKIAKLDNIGFNVAIVCNQCSEAFCAAACPVDAISIDQDTGAWIVNEKLCLVCRTCVVACPFGAIRVSPDPKILKCNLCNGDPECAKNCETGALVFQPAERMEIEKRYANARTIASTAVKSRGEL